MKTALVTGGSGLIGRALVARLREMGMTVYAPPRGAVIDSLPLVDYVVHAAGYGQPERFLCDPLETINVATVGLLEAAGRLKHDGTLLFLSSSEVYSGSKSVPHIEDDIGTTSPSHPRACYVEGKRCGEAIVHALRSRGINAKIARVSLVYGPARFDDKRVMFDFIRQAMTDGVIRLRDSGAALRTYCWVDDAVAMLINILTRGREAVYNVGGVSRVNIHALACMISRRLAVRVEGPVEMGSPSGAPDEVAVDLTHYIAEFGGPAFLDLSVGLDRVIDVMRAQSRPIAA